MYSRYTNDSKVMTQVGSTGMTLHCYVGTSPICPSKMFL